MQAWMINKRIRTPLLLMVGIEGLIAFSSVYVAVAVSIRGFDIGQSALHPLAPKAAVVTLVVLVSLVAVGLYQFHQRISFTEAVVRIVVGLFVSCLALAAVYYVMPAVMISRNVAPVAVVYVLLLLLVFRYILVRTVDENVFRHRTMIFGTGKRAQSISSLRRRADRRGFKIVARVPAANGADDEGGEDLDSIGKSILDTAERQHVDEIVVAVDERRGRLPIRELLDAKLRGIEVIDIVEFLERETGKIHVDLVHPGWLVFSPGFRSTWFRRSAKFVLDLVVSAAGLVVGSPLMLLVVAAIKLEDGIRAPVFYRQTRVGRGGVPFEVLKFRSMGVDAESGGRAVWAHTNDARVTWVGRILRKFRIDEMPQLLNVLRGEMSMVGPRPERPEFERDLLKSIPYYSERHIVKPGITGWAQLRYAYGATEIDALEKLQYDLYYIKNHSLILDIMIILQTVEVVLWRKGAR